MTSTCSTRVEHMGEHMPNTGVGDVLEHTGNPSVFSLQTAYGDTPSAPLLQPLRELESQQREQGGATWGPRALREFTNAPPAIQDSFIARLAAQVEAERDFDRWIEEVHDDDPAPPRQPERKLPRRPVRWDATWSKRARAARRRGNRRDLIADERDALTAIEPETYWLALTGEDVRCGPVLCPLPDHDDHEPSASLTSDGWYCHVCGIGGGIYQLAGALWGLKARGPEWREIHDRLCELMGVRA